jgi:hypothetical protein
LAAVNSDQARLDFAESQIQKDRDKVNAKNFRPHNGNDSCAHCGGPTKEWRHGLSAQLAKILIRVYQYTRSHGSTLFRARDLHLGYAAESNLQKLKYWRVIEHRNRDEERAALWHFTETGEKFVRATIRLPKKVWTYRTAIVEYEGEAVYIGDLVPDYKTRLQWAQEESRPHEEAA